MRHLGRNRRHLDPQPAIFRGFANQSVGPVYPIGLLPFKVWTKTLNAYGEGKIGNLQGVSMVRELTKSALSFSWALSLLGIKQAINLGRPGQQAGSGDLFAPLTQAAVGQLDESMKNLHRSGDNLQSRVIDMAFVSINPSNWTSGRPMGNVTPAQDAPSAQTRQQATGVIDSSLIW